MNFDLFSTSKSRFNDVLWALEELADKHASREYEEFFGQSRFKVIVFVFCIRTLNYGIL
jgi:hypothetical protein